MSKINLQYTLEEVMHKERVDSRVKEAMDKYIEELTANYVYDEWRDKVLSHLTGVYDREVKNKNSKIVEIIKQNLDLVTKLKSKQLLPMVICLLESPTLTGAISSYASQISKKYKTTKYTGIQVASLLMANCCKYFFKFIIQGDGNTRVVVIPKFVSMGFLDKLNLKLPMVVPPSKVTSLKDDGMKVAKYSTGCMLGRIKKHGEYIDFEALNISNATRMCIDEYIFKKYKEERIVIPDRDKRGYVRTAKERSDLHRLQKDMRTKKNELITDYLDEDHIYFNNKYDSRLRQYVFNTLLNYQQSDKALVNINEPAKLTKRGQYWIRIDLANCYGATSDPEILEEMKRYVKDHQSKYPKLSADTVVMSGDKSTWTEREIFGNIVKDPKYLVSHTDAKLIKSADEPKMFDKALNASYEVGKTTHTMGLDATASGLQFISIMMGDPKGMINSNLGMGAEDKRIDYYTEMCNAISFDISRSDMKGASMPNFYNSSAKPREIFGEGTPALEAFYEARDLASPGIRKFQTICNEMLWDNDAEFHNWKLPDGCTAVTKSFDLVEDVTIEAEVGEISCPLAYNFKEYGACEYYIPLAANIIQSVDAYMVRKMIKKCDRDGFSIITIHDAFHTHPNNIDKLRANYIESLNEMVDEELMDFIGTQLNSNIKFHKPPKDVMRNIIATSSYAIS